MSNDIERDGQVIGRLQKVTEQAFGSGLATTITRTRWTALNLDGRHVTGGRTKAEARQNFLDVMDEADRIRSSRS